MPAHKTQGAELETKRTPKDRFTPSQVIAALRASGGIKLAAARMLKCSPSTITNYLARHPEIAEANAAIEQEMLDIAETVIIRGMGRDHNPGLQFKAAVYYLREKGGSRGYGRHKRAANRENEQSSYDLSRLSDEERKLLSSLLEKALIPT